MPDRLRPSTPWRPAKLRVWGVYRRQRGAASRAADSTNRLRPVVVKYDVRFQVDGHEYRYGFDKKAWADEFASSLQEEFVKGWEFDPVARRFVAPQALEPEEVLTWLAFAADYFARKWLAWSPASRRHAQADFARASVHLVADEAPELNPAQRVEADRCLRTSTFIVPRPEKLSDAERRWDEWFASWSLPLRDITDAHLHRLMETIRITTLGGRRRLLGAASLKRTRAVLRGAFKSAYKRRLIEWDPWTALEWKLPPDLDRIDSELVMDPAQVFELADACGVIDRRYHCFVLIQGLCGLRPGEARDLRRRDLDVRSTPGTVTVGGSYSDVGHQFFDPGESRRRPLKGRGPRATRSIAIPTRLVPLLHAHLEEFVGERADALVFTTAAGSRINLSRFNVNVWSPAREKLFAEDSALRHVRRHDLRHSAITTWLNCGVTLKTAQRWSGHKTASVLLDTYLGVVRDDASISLGRVDQALEEALGDTPEP